MPKTVRVDGSAMWAKFTSDHELPLSGFVVELEWAHSNGEYESQINEITFSLLVMTLLSRTNENVSTS